MEVHMARIPTTDRCKPIRDQIVLNKEEIEDLKKIFQCGTPSEKGDAGSRIRDLRTINASLYSALGQCEAVPDGPPIFD
jgi:hypothetical protein